MSPVEPRPPTAAATRRRLLTVVLASAASITGLSGYAAPVAAAGEPVFHMPFACGETWSASTRAASSTHTDSLRVYPEHNPSVWATDWNHTSESGTRDDRGMEVLAGADGGVVVNVGESGQYNDGLGDFVDVLYGDPAAGGVQLRFAHLQTPPAVHLEDRVDAQTVVGLVGDTGAATGADHLHYEQRVLAGGTWTQRPIVIESRVWTVGDDPASVDIRDDRDDLAGHPGVPHISENCGGTASGPDGSLSPAPVLGGHWMSPVGSATIGPRPKLVAWPSSALEDVAVSQVDFHATWPGGSGPLCTATEGDSAGLWTCQADLLALRLPEGPLGLTFDVFDDAGDVTRAAGGVQQVSFAMPPADPQAYLKAGIPESIRSTCSKRKRELVPGTMAAVDCELDSPDIDYVAYYLLRPDAARAAFEARVDDEGLRPDGDCATGRAGVEVDGGKSRSACFQESGVANLRFVRYDGCPAIYVAVVGKRGGIGRLTKAYRRVVGDDWVDPGMGEAFPGCSGPLLSIAPPPAPERVRLRVSPQGCGDRLYCPWFRFRVSWSPVPGATGFRVYVEDRRYTWDWMCSLSWRDGSRRLLASVGPRATSVGGSFEPSGRGDWSLAGQRYTVVAVNDNGPSTPRVAAVPDDDHRDGFQLYPYGDCAFN